MFLKPLIADGADETNKALSIYKQTAADQTQSPVEHLLYWIKHIQGELPSNLHIFAVYRDTTVIGFLQYRYLAERHLLFFDFLCLADSRRKTLKSNAREIFTTITNHIYGLYADPHLLAVLEVAWKGSKDNWAPDSALIRYFEAAGFKKIDFPYAYPSLQTDNLNSYPADLMVRVPVNVDINNKIGLILRALYFDHYLHWSAPFLSADQGRLRTNFITNLFSEKMQIAEEMTIREVTGKGSLDAWRPSLKVFFLGANEDSDTQLARLIVYVGIIVTLVAGMYGSNWQLGTTVITGVIGYLGGYNGRRKRDYLRTPDTRRRTARLN